MKNEIKDTRIIYVGIGVFLWLSVGGFSVLFKNTITDFLLILNVQPTIIAWTKLFVQLIIYLIGFILGLNIIKSSKKAELIIFRNVILIFVLGQILQYLQPRLTNLISKEENYYNNLSKYLDLNSSEPTFYLIIPLLGFLIYAIVGVLIYLKR